MNSDDIEVRVATLEILWAATVRQLVETDALSQPDVVAILTRGLDVAKAFDAKETPEDRAFAKAMREHLERLASWIPKTEP